MSQQNLLFPLDDLVKKYSDRIKPRQLIRKNGRVLAIAAAANTKTLVVHKSFLLQEKLAVPTTYAQLLQTADKLKNSSIIDDPVVLSFKSGWHATQQFLDLYLAS